MQNSPNDITGVSETRMLAALAYLGVLIVVPFFQGKNDPYVNFHLRQGLLLFILIIVAIVASAWAPRIGSMLFALLAIVDIVALAMSLQGRKWKIPIVGSLAEKIRI